MATLQDQTVGFLFLAIASIVFAYYTTWVMVMPFVDADHALQQYFLPRQYAILGPLALLVTGLSGVGAFIGYVIVQSEAKKRNKAKKAQ
ncbi:Dolichol phosphate-mannose biosynthesis regulatory protein [Sorochytrium milnesiophthora]